MWKNALFLFCFIIFLISGAAENCYQEYITFDYGTKSPVLTVYSDMWNEGSVVTFSCDPKFEIYGATSATCRTIWLLDKGAPPGCKERTKCDALPSLVNGQVVCTDGVLTESECTFTCNPGYTLEGAATTLCQSSNFQWTNSVPLCPLTPCSSIDITNGGLTCTDGFKASSECTFTCDEGFILEGAVAQVTCVSAAWSDTIPTCKVNTCPTLSAPSNANMDCTNGMIANSECTFTCNEGYTLEGTTAILCDASNLQWSNNAPSCPLSPCSSIDITNGGLTCTDGFKASSECTFTCDEGFILEGAVTQVTCVSPAWSDTIPTCKVNTCPTLSAPSNANMDCTNGMIANSECTFTCNEGHTLEGATSTLCDASNLQWSNNAPSCPLTPCSSIDVTNGGLTCTDGFKASSECTFTCDEGFILEGAVAQVTCVSAAWSDTIPTCKVNTCPTLSAPSNANMDCTNGMIANSECTFTCNEGHTLEGATAALCDASNLQWSNDAPSCPLTPCSSIDITNGGLTCTDGFKASSECTFTCDEGFILEGAVAQVTCVSAAWSDTIPTCKDTSCDAYPDKPNGNVECTDGNKLGSTCVLTCSADYILKGEESIDCVDSQWTNEVPNCVRAGECPTLDEMPHGSFTCSNELKETSECTFSCEPNYSLVGESAIICGGDSKWNHPQPICEGNECPTLSAPSNANMDCTNGILANSECTFTCNEGYTLEGASNARCEPSNLQWSNLAPSCQLTPCSSIDITNGGLTCTDGFKASSECTFTCDEGFILEGAVAQVTCVSAAWSDTIPTCKEKVCDAYPDQANGNVECTDGNKLGSTCVLTCSADYILKGEGSIECVDSQWTSEVPDCVKAGECPTLDEMSHGSFTCSNEMKETSECTFSCEPNYSLVGESAIICGGDSKWNHPQPICQGNECPTLSAPANANMDCTNGILANSECTFTCNERYTLEGASNARCEASNLQWSNVAPSCKKTSCDAYPDKPNGNVECTDGNKLGSTCVLSCSAGFTLKGGGSIECVDSQWTHEVPNCVKTGECPTLDEMSHGSFTCSNELKETSECTFSCEPNYSLVGESAIICGGDSKWNHPQPICEEKACPTLSVPSNANMDCTNGMIANSECTFTCNEGHTLEGATAALCDASNLQWSNDAPSCTIAPCPVIELTNGDVICTDGIKESSECTFTCHEKYRLQGDVNSTICISGVWSDTIPTCKATSCDDFPAQANGQVNCTGSNKVGSVCVLSCSPGYSLKGAGSIKCIDGKWTHEMPTCFGSVECPALDEILHGSFTCSNNFMMSSECTFSCDPNYSLLGESQATCGRDSEWNLPQPKCEVIKRFCTPPLSLLYEDNADCDNMNDLNSNCIMTCGDQQSDVYVCKFDEAKQELAWEQKSFNCESFLGNRSPPVVCDKNIVDVFLLLNEPSSLEHTDVLNFFGNILDSLHKTIFAGYSSIWVGQIDSDVCDNHFQRKPAVGEKFNMFRGIVKEIMTIPNCWSTNFLSSSYDYIKTFGRGLAKPILLFLQTGPAKTNILKEAEKLISSGVKIVVVGMEGSKSEDFSSFGKNVVFLGPTTYLKLHKVLSPVVLQVTANNCPGSECSFLATNINEGSTVCKYVHGKGTVCEFVCDFGKVLIGNNVISCLQKNELTAEWDSPMPICGHAMCPAINATTDLSFRCTDRNEAGSRCTFTCPPGMFVKGSSFIACLLVDSRAFWNGEIPVCLEDLLCQPPLMAPSDGNLSCPGGNKFNAECKFRCDQGYNIEGAATLRCDTPLSNGEAQWNKQQPNCKVCDKPPCMQDLMVVLDISAASSEQNFRQQIDWLLKVLASYQGPVEVGDVQVGVMRVLATATLTCGNGQMSHMPEIITDLSSAPIEEVQQRVGDVEHVGRCPGTLISVKHAVDYFNAVGRSPDKVKRVILLLTNNHDQVALKKSQGYAETEDVVILTAKAGRLEVSGLEVTTGCGVNIGDDEIILNIETVNQIIASKGSSQQVLWLNYWIQAILLTTVTLR